MSHAALALAVMLLHQAMVPATVNIAGAKVPIDALKSLPHVIADVIDRAPPDKTIKDLLPAIEIAASLAYPGAGIAIAAIVFALKHSRPMTFNEEMAWMDRAGIGTQR